MLRGFSENRPFTPLPRAAVCETGRLSLIRRSFNRDAFLFNQIQVSVFVRRKYESFADSKIVGLVAPGGVIRDIKIAVQRSTLSTIHNSQQPT